MEDLYSELPADAALILLVAKTFGDMFHIQIF